LVKQAGQLLRADPRINFVGNVEGRDLFRDACDVIICD
jgi:glycerol-3-phosphate acyltransferase PlsX